MRVEFTPFRAAAMIVLVMGGSGTNACAASVTVPNFSFESPATTGELVTNNWVQVGMPTTTNDAYNPYQNQGGNAFYTGANPATDPALGGGGYPGVVGENLGFVFARPSGTGLMQTLTATLQANTRYTLTVAVGNRNGTTSGGFLGSQIALLAGGTVIASSTDASGPAAGTFRDQVAILANSSAFSGLIGQPLTLELLTTTSGSSSNGSVGPATDWDNVRLDASPATVPEPASLVLCGTAVAAGLDCWLRRRRHQ